MNVLRGRASGKPGDNFTRQLRMFLESLFDEEWWLVVYNSEIMEIEIKWVSKDKKTCGAIKKAAVAYTKAHMTIWGEFFSVDWKE